MPPPPPGAEARLSDALSTPANYNLIPMPTDWQDAIPSKVSTPVKVPRVERWSSEYVSCLDAYRAMTYPPTVPRPPQTAMPTVTSSTAAGDADVDILPDLPSWLLGGLLGCAVFVSTVAMVLLMAQFCTSSGGWIGRLRGNVRRRQYDMRYSEIKQEEYEMDGFYDGKMSGMGMTEGSRHGFGGEPWGVKRRKGGEKGKLGSLRVNTKGGYAGLGIAVPGHNDMARAETPQPAVDLEEKVISHRLKNAKTARSAYFSAPLLSTAYFTSNRETHVNKPSLSAFEASTDMEACRPTTSNSSSESLDLLDTDSQLYESAPYLDYEDNLVPRSAFLERINDGMEVVAGKMAKRFHDEVDIFAGPEEDVLLPIREEEREQALEKGAFVE